jgi:hypothetical protein
VFQEDDVCWIPVVVSDSRTAAIDIILPSNAVFVFRDEKMNMMTSDHRRDSTYRQDKDNLLRVGRRQETVCVVSITICLVSGRDGCHSASLYSLF